MAHIFDYSQSLSNVGNPVEGHFGNLFAIGQWFSSLTTGYWDSDGVFLSYAWTSHLEDGDGAALPTPMVVWQTSRGDTGAEQWSPNWQQEFADRRGYLSLADPEIHDRIPAYFLDGSAYHTMGQVTDQGDRGGFLRFDGIPAVEIALIVDEVYPSLDALISALPGIFDTLYADFAQQIAAIDAIPLASLDGITGGYWDHAYSEDARLYFIPDPASTLVIGDLFQPLEEWHDPRLRDPVSTTTLFSAEDVTFILTSGADSIHELWGFSAGLMRVEAGAGDDSITLQFRDAAPARLEVLGEDGNDSIVIHDHWSIPDIWVHGGAGDDDIRVFQTDLPADRSGQTVLINGGAGDDTIMGGGGNDTLLGGDGDDLAVLPVASDVVDAYRTAGGLRLVLPDAEVFLGDDIEAVQFTDGTLTYDAVAALRPPQPPLEGTDGNDWLNAGLRGRAVDGKGGIDMLSFVNLDERVVVDLGAGTAAAGAEDWQLQGIENVTGTIWADLITGDAGDNRLRGLGGYDWFVGSAGSDTYEGGTGRDTVSYALAARLEDGTGVHANLRSGTGTKGQATGDVYDSIESLTGSSHKDWLVGSDEANVLRGLAGDDIIFGYGGNDTIDGGAGNDWLDGGDGNDRITGGAGNDTIVGGRGWDAALYSGNKADYQVETWSNGWVSVFDTRGIDGVDILIEMNVIEFADGKLWLG